MKMMMLMRNSRHVLVSKSLILITITLAFQQLLVVIAATNATAEEFSELWYLVSGRAIVVVVPH